MRGASARRICLLAALRFGGGARLVRSCAAILGRKPGGVRKSSGIVSVRRQDNIDNIDNIAPRIFQLLHVGVVEKGTSCWPRNADTQGGAELLYGSS